MMVPQVVKSFRTKRVEDLSLPMTILYFFNCALWLTYGVMIGSWPVMVANSLALMISVFQVILKIRYGQSSPFRFLRR